MLVKVAVTSIKRYRQWVASNGKFQKADRYGNDDTSIYISFSLLWLSARTNTHAYVACSYMQ